MGNVYHAVLENFAGKLAESGRTWWDFDENFATQVHLLFFRQIHMNTVQILRKPEGQLIIVRLKASLLV